jgi:hypothetical protein
VVPQVFRAYLSEAEGGMGGAEEGGVSFFFKRRLSTPPLLLGVLPLERKREESGFDPGRVQVHLVRKEATGDYTLQVRFDAKGLVTAQRYDLMLVPLADSRLDLRKRIVTLKASPTGEFVTEIPLGFKSRETMLKGQAFGGVIGGILRTDQGDVLGKWPLAFLDEDSLRTPYEGIRTLPLHGEETQPSR